MPTEAQKRAWDKYRLSGKRVSMSLTMARRIYDDICAYAASRDLAPATCVRDCVRRCMALDGWPALPQVDRPGPARVETEKPAPRKRGRPRKNPIADTPGPDENNPAAPGAGLSEAAPDMPGPAVPVAGSAEYHAPGVEASPSEDSGPA